MTVSGMSIDQLTAGLANVGTIASNALGAIASNPVLMVCFAAGMLGVGFRVIHMARNF